MRYAHWWDDKKEEFHTAAKATENIIYESVISLLYQLMW